MRALGIELRRSAAPGGALLLCAAGALALANEYLGRMPGWMAVVTTQRTDVLLVWPLALAVGAWQARARHLAGVAELVGTTALPPWRRALPVALALGLAAAAAYVLTAVGGLAWFARDAGYRPPGTLLTVTVGALALVSGVCLGLALGRALPHAVTAPGLAVVGLAAMIGCQAASGRQPWLVHALSPALPRAVFSVRDVDLSSFSPQVGLAQAVWLACLAVTATALYAAGSRRARTTALVPVLVGAAVALALVPRGTAAPGVVRDLRAAELVCAAGQPRVCVARVHAAYLAEVTPAVRHGLAVLSRLPDPPRTAEEDLSDFDGPPPATPPGVARFPAMGGPASLYREDGWTVTAMAASVLDPRSCAGPAARAAAGWLAGSPAPTGDDPLDRRYARLRAALDGVPAAEALRRVQAVRAAAAADCNADLDRLVLAGPPA